MYTKRFAIKFTQELLADSDIFESFCNENEKDRAHHRTEVGRTGREPDSSSLRVFFPVVLGQRPNQSSPSAAAILNRGQEFG
jgi:hypothetical protein